MSAKTAVYLRVSTDEQVTEGYGLEAQQSQCEQYAALYDLSITHVYVDDGLSGTLPSEKRPALSNALIDARNGKFEKLLVLSIDRLARSARILLTVWDEFEAVGVNIVAKKEQIDTSTPAGRLMRTMFAAIAEFERDNIIERTTAGRNERGKIDGEKGGRVPMGYIRTAEGIAVDETWANLTRYIFALKQSGYGLRAIADQLRSKGFKTPRGGQWTASSVKAVVQNENKYRGGKRHESKVEWPAIL